MAEQTQAEQLQNTHTSIEQEGEWLVEGFEFRGPGHPKGGDWGPHDWIEIPHQHYIPVSLARFLKALSELPKAKASGELFHDFLEMLEAVYHVHYYKTLKELKEDYEYFSPDTGSEARVGVSEEELIQRQRRFLNNFLKSMIRGNFNPFSEEDFQHAEREDYLFDLPVEINWNVHDRRMIADYLEHVEKIEGRELAKDLELDTSVTEYLQMPEEFDSNVWVFYRGIEKNQTEGLFILQKIDLFLSKLSLLVWPIQFLIEKIRGDKGGEVQINSFGDVFDKIKTSVSLGLLEESKEEEEEDEEDKASSIFERRWLRRVNLGNQNLKLGDLNKKMLLQEPALQKMICLFRLKPPRPPQLLERIPIIKNFIKQPESDIDWTIQIKLFSDIPLADSEMIFPEKIIRMKSFDVTMLILTAFGGLFALYKGLQSGSKTVLVVIATVLVAYLIKLVIGYQRVRAKYMARVTRDLYHKNLDNNIGVIQYLIDSLEEQDAKEALLAYCMLWEGGRPMTEDELDAAAESWMQDNFVGLEVDFEVDDALDKVIEKDGPQDKHHLPIVRILEGPNGETLYEAKPIEEALRLIDEKWDNFYTYNE